MHRLETPENLSLSYDVADVGSRFVAALIDSLLMLAAITLAVIILVALSLSPLPFLSDWVDGNAFMWALVFMQLFFFAVFWGYYVFFEMAMHGQSPGKRLLKLRVVRQDGYPISLTNSIIRNLVRVADFLPAVYLLGVIAMLLNPQARRLGDLAAGTIVIKERADYRLGSLEARLGEDNELLPIDNIERLGPEDYHLVREFFLRSGSLPRPASARLAERIARGVARKLGDEVEPASAEAYLRRVGAAYEQYHRRSGGRGND